MLEANLARKTSTVTDRLFLRNAHLDRALALTDLQRYPEAVKDWDRALELEEGPERPALRLLRAVTLAHTRDHAKAIAEADELTRDDKTPGDTLYDAACVCGVAVLAVKDDAKLKEAYAGKALALLRRAQAAGFFNAAAQVEHLKKDDDLAALRDRAEFRQFVTDLEKRLPTSPPPKP